MSIISFQDNSSSLNEKEKELDIENNKDTPKQPENERIMKYKNLHEDFNLVSLKTRFTFQKIKSLMDEIKNEEINIENIDLKNEEAKNDLINKNIIQYYCNSKSKNKEYVPPSEEVLKKVRQFKRWQKFEIFKERGIKNYLNKLMPDYKLVHNTKKLIDERIKLVTKIKLKPNNSSLIILPKINNNSFINEKENETYNNEKNQNQSTINYNISGKLTRNQSMDEIVKKNYSKINNINSISKISDTNSNVHKSLIRLLNKPKKNLDHKNSSKEFKSSFDESTFCISKSLIPLSVNRSIKSTQIGGGILHCNSIMRHKNINNLVPYYSPKKIIEKFNDYKSKRNQIIHNRDYIYHLDNADYHTFITNLKNYNHNDYLIF